MRRCLVLVVFLLVVAVGCDFADSGDSAAPGQSDILSIRRAGPFTTATCPPGSTPDVAGAPGQTRPPPSSGGIKAAFDWESGVLVHLVDGPWSEGPRTWVFDPCANTWAQMDPDVEPPEDSSSLTYDRDSDLVLALGEQAWAYDFDGDTWEPKGTPPAKGRAVYHGPSGLIVVSSGEFDWAYDVDADSWYRLGPSEPPGERYARLMASDASTGDIYLYTLGARGRTWIRAEDGTWVDLGITTPGVPVGYFARGSEIAFDEATGTIVVFSGGIAIAFDPEVGEWETLYAMPRTGEAAAEAGALNRLGPNLTYDPLNHRIVMFGGEIGTDEEPWSESGGDVWAFDVRTREWIELLAAGT